MKQLLFLLILLLLGLTCYAQRSEVEQAMYEKYGKDNAAKGADWMKRMMNAKVEPEYRFPVMIQMHLTTYNKGSKKDESDLTYYINTTANRFAMRAASDNRRKGGDEMLMIYDYKANSMVMLNEKEKTGMAMNLNAFMSGEAAREKKEQQGAGKGNTDCKKTGKSRTIQGYLCWEYLCVDKERETRSEVWIAEKVPFDLSQTTGRSPMAGYFNSAKGLGGMMMEGNFYKGGNLEMKMEVQRVSNSENLLVKTDDYTFPMR